MRRNLRERIHDGFVFLAPTALLKKMASCERITERISFSENQTVKERLETAFHIAICQACWTYRKQLERMRVAYLALQKKRTVSISKEKLEETMERLTKKFSKQI